MRGVCSECRRRGGVLSGNSVEHATMMQGAMKARVPIAPVPVVCSPFCQIRENAEKFAKLLQQANVFIE